jgi:hypothetical protein
LIWETLASSFVTKKFATFRKRPKAIESWRFG